MAPFFWVRGSSHRGVRCCGNRRVPLQHPSRMGGSWLLCWGNRRRKSVGPRDAAWGPVGPSVDSGRVCLARNPPEDCTTAANRQAPLDRQLYNEAFICCLDT
jgi:hypothetical protein